MLQVILQNKIQKDYSTFKAIVDDTLTEVTSQMLDEITKIISYAFYQCKNLISIEIPDSVISIGASAFAGCTALSSILDISGIAIIQSGLFLAVLLL